MLLGEGADTETRDNDGFTALHIADRAKDQSAVVRALLEGDADKDARCTNLSSTALIRAADSGSLNNAKVLLEAGADANVVTNDKQTALSLSMSKEYSAVARVLVERGAYTEVAKALLEAAARNSRES